MLIVGNDGVVREGLVSKIDFSWKIAQWVTDQNQVIDFHVFNMQWNYMFVVVLQMQLWKKKQNNVNWAVGSS